MTRDYDVLVIGSGPAGGMAATECRRSGLMVAVVESDGFGGTCPLRGCNPKKVLVGAAEIVARAMDMRGKGIGTAAQISWPELIRFKRTFTEPVSEQVKNSYADAGIDAYRGVARFVGPREVRVGAETLAGSHVVVGSGAVPRKLNLPGEEYVLTSDRFLDLPDLPESVLFIGGGYISFEFAHIAARAGARVVILEMTDLPLARFDPDLVRLLIKASEDIGIEIHCGMPVRSVERDGSGFTVSAGQDRIKMFRTDLVFHGAGRVPNIEGLSLEAGGIEFSSDGIFVNAYMQSVSNPEVYAIGDVAATPFQLTPSAAYEAHIASCNIIGGNTHRADFSGIPSVAFTVPPLASVGLTEAEAKEKGIDYRGEMEDTASDFASRRIGLAYSARKILFEKDTGKLLGAHILGHHAEEAINVLGAAIRLGLTADRLEQVLWAYPSSIYTLKHVFE